jgi:hypothetical protein
MQIGLDDDPMGTARKPQASVPRRTERGCEMLAALFLVFQRRATSWDCVPGINRMSALWFVHAVLSMSW